MGALAASEHFTLTLTLMVLLILSALAIITIASIVVLLRYQQSTFSRVIKDGNNVLLVTAHPGNLDIVSTDFHMYIIDDECLFFSPIIRRLVKTKGVKLSVLCLCNGNHDGLGRQREKELKASCKVLGLADKNVTIVSHP